MYVLKQIIFVDKLDDSIQYLTCVGHTVIQ